MRLLFLLVLLLVPATLRAQDTPADTNSSPDPGFQELISTFSQALASGDTTQALALSTESLQARLREEWQKDPAQQVTLPFFNGLKETREDRHVFYSVTGELAFTFYETGIGPGDDRRPFLIAVVSDGENLKIDHLLLGSHPDVRIIETLENAAFSYSVDTNGALRILVAAPGDRSQYIWIYSNTFTSYHMGDVELREISSMIIASDEPLAPETSRLLLENNGKASPGTWIVQQTEDGQYYAVITATISATLDATTFLSAVNAIAETADGMEQTITGKDEY